MIFISCFYINVCSLETKMEDDAVNAQDKEFLDYQIAKCKFDKKSWKEGWAESKIFLSEARLEYDHQEAKKWFRAHPDYISPDIAHHFS